MRYIIVYRPNHGLTIEIEKVDNLRPLERENSFEYRIYGVIYITKDKYIYHNPYQEYHTNIGSIPFHTKDYHKVFYEHNSLECLYTIEPLHLRWIEEVINKIVIDEL